MTQEVSDELESNGRELKQFKDRIKEKWGNLTDDDLDTVAIDGIR